MSEIITVTGQGTVHVQPDVTRLKLSLESLHDSYDDAYAQAKANTERLAKIMAETNLDVHLPKTTRLDIDKKTVNEYDRNDHFTGIKFVGFQLDHCVVISLGMDAVQLNSVVKKVGQYLKQAEISIEHSVKDSTPIKLLMLERAVKDAQKKAEIMAKACGCELGKVADIEYGEHALSVGYNKRLQRVSLSASRNPLTSLGESSPKLNSEQRSMLGAAYDSVMEYLHFLHVRKR